jgi:hypothetical protein
MSFQWLNMRISEENDRRNREKQIMERLPGALEEVHQAIILCIESYRQAFGSDAAEIYVGSDKIRIAVRMEQEGRWQQSSRVEVAIVPSIPGFQIDGGTGGEPLIIEVGVLPGGNLFYRDRAKDQYVTMDELTKRTLDRALFPNLKE